MQKCEFLQKQVECLGFNISDKGIYPTKDKTNRIINLSPSTNRKQLKRFLEMFNHCKRLYKTTDVNLETLCDLMSPNKIFKWTIEAQVVFDKIKDLLLLDTSLVLPDFSQPFCIDSDSSDYQIGGITYQKHGVIACHSRTLTKCQQQYSTPEKETLAIVDMLKTFRTTLLGNKIIVNTDALNLLGKKTSSSQITGWLLMLQEFNIALKHITGESNVFADTLSRLKRFNDYNPYEINE